ncbi:MAG: 1,6-anhydro-N-acetylmuramyl-L-alanine amidase AmpD [Candidatus Thiodiazotropha sp.]
METDQIPVLLPGTEFHPSPNCDPRPADAVIDLLVIHSISLPPGGYGGTGIDDLFLNRLDPDAHPFFATIHTLKVSSHLLIGRNGSIIQYVPFEMRAWHAGASNFCGRGCCNDFSIGIELEGCDEDPYTDAQYLALVRATHWLMQRYPGIRETRITSHSAIAPGRKTDPGPHFDWRRYRKLLHALNG